MARWDQGGGCACGVSAICDCNHNRQSDGSRPRKEPSKITLTDLEKARQALDKAFVGIAREQKQQLITEAYNKLFKE